MSVADNPEIVHKVCGWLRQQHRDLLEAYEIGHGLPQGDCRECPLVAQEADGEAVPGCALEAQELIQLIEKAAPGHELSQALGTMLFRRAKLTDQLRDINRRWVGAFARPAGELVQMWEERERLAQEDREIELALDILKRYVPKPGREP